MMVANFPGSFDVFRRQMNGALSNALRELTPRPYPALNIWQSGDGITIEAELPGLSMQDIEVIVEGQDFTIKGNRPTLSQEGVNSLRIERATGEFTRTVTLPADLDLSTVDATLKDGVLTAKISRNEKAKPRKVEVKTV